MPADEFGAWASAKRLGKWTDIAPVNLDSLASPSVFRAVPDATPPERHRSSQIDGAPDWENHRSADEQRVLRAI